jgi:putative transcriptional regulator
LIDFNFENKAPLQSGSILLSEPFGNDDYFSRSMIFICDFNEDGCFGFILNKYIENQIGDFVEDFPTINTEISIGGPVDISNLFYIHSLGDEIPNALPISKGLFIGGDFSKVKEILLINPDKSKQIRFFVGYSGWEKGQLEAEIKNKSWIVLNNIPKEEILDTSHDDIWTETMEKLGGKYKVMSQFPQNPSDN